MISIANLLVELGAAGVSLRVEDGQLIASPGRLLTPALREAIRASKPALLDVISGRQAALDAYEADNPPDFAGAPVLLRPVALMEIEPGKWFACDPALVAFSRAWNAEAKAKWLKEHPCER